MVVAARIRSISPGRLLRGGSAIFFATRGTDIPARPEERRVHHPRTRRTTVCALVVALLLGAGPPSARSAQSQSVPPHSAAPPTAASSGQPRAKKKKKSARAARRQLAPDPARIREIQQALAREGFYEGDPTGKWDPQTVSAMKGFQQAKGLPPTGKIEALSLQKLGLGSATAGLAPPEPKTPPEPRAPTGASPPGRSSSRPQ